MKAVVLQPMYLPWMGYFGMIDQADVFVFYDDVQFSRNSWQQRNRIKVPEASGQTKWLKVPVIEDFGQDIESVQVDQGKGWRQEHLSLIKSAYGHESIPYGTKSATFFDEYIDFFEDTFSKNWEYLGNLNTYLIQELSKILGLTDVEFYFSSDFDINGSGTEKLIRTLQYIDADKYISGPGAKDYIDTDMFDKNNIGLFWHEFNHPEYNQLYSGFVSHLSIIDILFNTGEEATNIIKNSEDDALVQEV